MFLARCAAISLALFVLLYVPASLAVSRGWGLLPQVVKPRTARGSADLLFALRMLPFVLAAVFTLVFALPSFLLLEPRSTDEAVGTAPLMLGLCCLGVLAAGAVRSASAQIRTSRALTKWMDGSTVMDSAAPVPVFITARDAVTARDAPSLTVAGVRDPKVLVSEAAIAALTPPELRAALKHEAAHAQSYDNLKKLLFRLAVFPGMAGLERAWSEQSELAADDAAVLCFRDALDLAGALIKVSRLGTWQPQAELTTGLLHSSTALGTRVQRLISWKKNSASATHGTSWRYALPSLCGTLFVLVATYGSVLTGLHAVTEWLVR
jgi:Zn-dependent protease with chaperone function